MYYKAGVSPYTRACTQFRRFRADTKKANKVMPGGGEFISD